MFYKVLSSKRASKLSKNIITHEGAWFSTYLSGRFLDLIRYLRFTKISVWTSDRCLGDGANQLSRAVYLSKAIVASIRVLKRSSASSLQGFTFFDTEESIAHHQLASLYDTGQRGRWPSVPTPSA